MQNELKPCPKCGGEAELIAFDRKAFGVWRIYFFYAQCRLCGNRTSVSIDENAVIEAWNRRANDETSV